MGKKLCSLFKRYNEIISYIIFGGMTVVVNTLIYVLLCYIGLNDLIANTIAFFVAVQFAYFTNTKYVFKTVFTKQNFLQFWSMRIGTIFIDNIGLILLINIGIERLMAKSIVNIIIIVLNYIFSKFFIYKKL